MSQPAGDVERVVRDALHAGEPAGVFLSSGPGSGVVLATARAASAGPLYTYFLRFDESTPSSDYAYAARLARAFGATHQEIMVPARTVAEMLPFIASVAGDRECDHHTVTAALLAHFAARDVRTFLCGARDGGVWSAFARAASARLVTPCSGVSDEAIGRLAHAALPGEVLRRAPEPLDVPYRAWLLAARAVHGAARADSHEAGDDDVRVAWRAVCARVRRGTPPAQPLAAARTIVPARVPAPPRSHRARVLLVGPLPPPLGGVQIANELLLLSSLADDFELHVVDTSKKRLRWAVEAPSWRTPIDVVRHAWSLARAMRRVRPDAVYVHAAAGYSLVRDWVLMTIARALGTPVICHYHGTAHTHFPSTHTRAGRAIGRAIMASASRIICLGPSYRDAFRAAWKRDDMTVMPNAADSSVVGGITEDSRAPWLRPGEKGLLFVGRLSAPKGAWDLLAAAPAILHRHPTVRFLLMGVAETAAQEEPFRACVRNNGLAERVTFLGSLQGAAKALAYATAHAFVLPSWTEAFPLVIPEAMAAGLPMVVTSVGCIPDYVTDGVDGYVVPPRDPVALAEAVNTLLSDEPARVRMSAHVRARGREEFDVEACAGIARAVIASVLPRDRRPTDS